ncbi:MAG: amidohydrolase family protein [Chloroflexi bacterium]|nr:amidohydrolase family protein [Chloroflexota bacterium]
MPFDDIPLIDDHAHPMLPSESAAREPFARYFTEGHDEETVARHAPQTLFYRHAVRELAAFLGCEVAEESVVAARAAQPFDQYLRRLLADAGVETVLLDDGYPRTGALSVAETAAAGGVRAGRILRIERAIEDLIPAHETVAGLREALLGELEAARPGLAALKSIIAYRSGLILGRPEPGEAERSLHYVRHAWAGTPGRLASKTLLDYLVPAAASWAAEHGLPVQFHTGFGDRDVDIRTANPLHLRSVLEDGPLSRGPVVLLHTSYPYVREAAYLANVYPNVYIDLSEAAPLLAGPGLTRVLEELLALAPVTKLLYGSDAWAVPEWFWLAARAARQSLAEALVRLPPEEQQWAARRILHDNAAELYQLT